MTHRRTRVEIDANDHTEVFDAVVRDGEHWNGFACPFFNADTVLRIAAWIAKTNDDYCTIVFDSDGETVNMVESSGLDDIDVARISPSLDGLYAIGSWGWTWQELPAEAPEEPEALDNWLAARAAVSAIYCKASNAALHKAYAEGADVPTAVAASKAVGAAALEALRG